MIGTGRAFRAEGYRLARSRVAWAALLAVGLLSALRVVAAYAGRTAEHATRVRAALVEGRDAPPPFDAGNAFAPFVDGWIVGLTLGTLVLLIHFARTLAGDREAGVLRLASTRSVSRSGLVLGRALLAPVGVLLVVAASGFGAWAAAEWLFEFGPLVEDGFQVYESGEVVAELRTGVLAAASAMVATSAFGLFVSVCGRGATGAVGLALLAFLGFDLFKETLGDDASFVFASHAPTVFDSSYLKEVSVFAKGYNDWDYPDPLGHWVPWGEAVLLVGLTCWIQRRRSL